jgi:predicted DCC family thiol-disulfide oxidoreductase YuxK
MSESVSAPACELEVFYDGGCPMCRREIALLRNHVPPGRILFTDFDAPGFDPAAVGKDHAELMARIHGRLPDGNWITGVEVFRRLYAAAGFGPLVALSRLPGVSQVLDVGYRIFARNRTRITGRCTDERCGVRPN